MIAATFYIGIIVLIILYYIIISNTYDTKGFIIGTSQYTPERKIKIEKTYLLIQVLGKQREIGIEILF